MVGKRKRLVRAGDQLRHLLDHATAIEDLTCEESEWVEILRDRFYEIANRIPRDDSDDAVSRLARAGYEVNEPYA
ncbi:MAG: hypothetical protein GY926_11570 [bacterium]|nr:hypothetical protein [bacterium]